MKARINRILRHFSDPLTPELTDYVSGFGVDEQVGTIDAGMHYDPNTTATQAEIVKEHLQGWH